MQLQRGLSASVSAAETRLESSAGTPGHSEKKLESRTSQQAEDIARDSFFSARPSEWETGDRHERIFTPSLTLESFPRHHRHIRETHFIPLRSVPLSIGAVRDNADLFC